jgi:hypothetical protein
MNTSLIPRSPEVVHAQNEIAAALSIVLPGLGHIYKGHLEAGLLWMFLGMPVALWIGVLLSLATAGAGLLLPILCWAGLAVDAYYEKDRRRHHWEPGPETIYDDFD